MKNATLICLLICISGCVSTSPARKSAASTPAPVVYAYQMGEGTCYLRYLQQTPLDQICVNEENIRYSVSPDMSQTNYLPMPVHVEALFNSISVERVLRHRSSMGSAPVSNGVGS